MNIFNWILSFIVPVPIRKYQSSVSGTLYISLENGKKVLNTDQVNYSYNSLHRVFRNSFRKGGLDTSRLTNCLLLGLGGGSVVQILRKEYGYRENVDCIELDPVIIEIARKEFYIENFAPVVLIHSDAYEFVLASSGTYGLICVDIFVNDQVPEKMGSSAFIGKLTELCAPGGTIYFNTMDEHACRLIEQELKQKYPGVETEIIRAEETNFVFVIHK